VCEYITTRSDGDEMAPARDDDGDGVDNDEDPDPNDPSKTMSAVGPEAPRRAPALGESGPAGPYGMRLRERAPVHDFRVSLDLRSRLSFPLARVEVP
jgi:hypothetical protein